MNNTEHAVMAAEWEHFASLRGQTLEDYVNREFGGLEKAFTTNPNTRIDAAMKEGQKIKGAVSFEDMSKDAKAVIYLSKNADLSTFIHEMGHIYRRRLQGDMLKQAEKLWGVKDGNWTTAQEEQFTEDLERWRRDGAAPSAEMKSFFEKFAEFLKNIVNAISKRESVSPEIKEFFDNLYTGETSQNTNNTENNISNREGNINESTYEANKKFNDERPLLDKNNKKTDTKPKQPSNNLDDIYSLVEESREEFDRYVQELQEKYGGEIISRKNLKKRARAERKNTSDEGAENILDINGKTLVLNDLQTIVTVLEDLHGRDEVLRIKDRFKVLQPSHYRDMFINLRLSNGSIVELQLNTPQFISAKREHGGHLIYEIKEQVEKGYENKLVSLEEFKNIDVLCDETQTQLYDAAFSASLVEAKINESSLEMVEELVLKISEYLGHLREGLNVLSEDTRKAVQILREKANGISSTSQNSRVGSSKLGTSTLETGDVNLSSDLVEEDLTESSNISVPSTISIEQKINSVNTNLEKNSEENEKRIEKAKKKWEVADRVKGAEDQVTLQTGEEIKGHYELAEAGSSTASVDPDADFQLSQGFPVNENGTSMNVGRDYTGGFSQNAAVRMAGEFDQRGIGIIVDSNGVTSSGNNRDISRRIAAKNGTDSKYIAYLKSRPERWGFTQEDIAKFEHPTLYFVVNAPTAYTPLYFDQFNRSGKKSISPIETAIKMSYLIDDDIRKEFSTAMGNYDSIGELYDDTQAATNIFQSLMKRNIVTENSYPDYVETVSIKGKQQQRITSGGKEFLESVMLGGVLNEDSIRVLSRAEDIRKRVVKGVAALVDNAALGEYSVIDEMNQAINIAVEIQTNKKKYKSISDYADQTEMDLGQKISSDIEIELAARLLEKTEYAIADMMGGLNAVLQEEAGGQGDMFGGTSKNDILRRYLGIKAKMNEIREANNKIIDSKEADTLEKVEAAMQNAGIARDEAGGTFFQTGWHGSAAHFLEFDNRHMGSGVGAQAFGYGQYVSKKRTVADGYRRQFASTQIFIDSKQIAESEMWKHIDTYTAAAEGTLNERIADLESQLSKTPKDKQDLIKKEFKLAKSLINKTVEKKRGQLYKVEIPDDAELLNWDKELKSQKNILKMIREQAVKEDIDDVLYYGGTGGEFYANELVKMLGNPKEASAFLYRAGVKGNKHFDARDDAYNFVIFEGSEIDITQTFFQTEELTDEEKEIIEAAKSVYGTTTDFNEAGYLLVDGTMLDFSEKNNGAPPGSRNLDHYEMNYFEHEGKVYTPGILSFLNMGNIRIKPEIGGIDLSVKPSREQISTLRKFINYHNGNIIVDFSTRKDRIAENSIYYTSENTNKIINDIINYYDKGIVPEQKPVLFQLEDDLIEDASRFHSWREFRDSVESGETAEADNAWYRSIWNDARKIIPNTTLFSTEDLSRAEELDKRFYSEADKKYLNEALKELYRIHNDQTLEPTKEESGAAREDYNRIKRLQRRINTDLPNAGSIIGMAAQVRSGRELSSTQYDRLKAWMRKNKRDYRAVFADVMNQSEFLEELADTKDGEPKGRLADPRLERQDTKARLKEIASIVRDTDPALAKEIKDGTIAYDDPRIAAFETGVDAEYKEAREALETIENETAQDYARLANDAQKRIVSTYEKMIAAREQMEVTDERVQRMMNDEGKIAEPYLNRQRLEKANYEQALKAYNDLINIHGKDAEVREAVARREARSNERSKQKGIMRRQRAARALREIKQKLTKRITRKISDNVNYEQAKTAKAIQRIFFEIVFDGINKWVGLADRKILREIWSQWSTDEEFRTTLTDQIRQRYQSKTSIGDTQVKRITDILNKEWKKITVNDKRALYKLLPETDLIKKLGLKDLARENRESIQLDIDEHEVDGKAQLIIGEELKRELKETLGDDLYNRILNKPLNEWTITEAEELAKVIDNLVVEGKRDLAAKNEARRMLEQEYRDKILETIKRAGFNSDDSPEEREKKLKKFAKGKKNNFINNFFDGNLRRFTTAMDGGRKGVFTNLLYWAENDAFNQEQRQIDIRRNAIDQVMKENNITIDELYKEVKIEGLDDTDIYRVNGGKLTVDDLLYIIRGYQNEETREAIMYGNLSNARERNRYNNTITDISGFSNVAHGRMMLVMSHAREFFNREENKKFMKLYEAIGTDYDNNGERLNRACIEIFNRPMWRVDNYVPMNRREQTGNENENRVVEDLLGMTGAGMKWVNRGFTEKRIKLKPSGQKPIELGLYKTWAGSVTSTEHLLAYGPLVQKLNAVFKGIHSAEVKQAIQDRWGKAAIDRINNTIAEFANPNATKQRNDLDNFVRALRGKTATAYLAYKTSGVLLQAVTSPWPYLQEISPLHYIPACLEVAGGFGKVNDFIREKSVFMKTRQFDPMIKIIEEQMENTNNPILGKLNKFNKLGMQGLERVDWAAVAPGWLAKYRSELSIIAREQEAKYQELLKKFQSSEYDDVLPTQESKINRALSEVMNDEQQDYEAVARADDMVRRLQPSSRKTDIAQMFKDRNEIVSAVLQFQVSLNTIWQNLRYDIPLAIKEKQIGTLVGMVTGYALAGICLGLLHDDDDEEEKRNRNWTTWLLYNSLTQFTDSVPVIGSLVNTTSEQLITGKRKYWTSNSIFPSIEKALTGTSDLANAMREDDPDKQKDKFLKAAGKITEAIGITLGLPVSGIKELIRALGISDGEFNLYLEALMGRRK